MEVTQVKVYGVHPGAIKTELFRHTTVGSIASTFLGIFMKSIPQGAATTAFAATDPSLEDHSGIVLFIVKSA